MSKQKLWMLCDHEVDVDEEEVEEVENDNNNKDLWVPRS